MNSYFEKREKQLGGKIAFYRDVFLSVKDNECDSDAENEQNHDPNVEEFLQQQDTAVIYPEAPEEDQRQGTPEASSHDENGEYSLAHDPRSQGKERVAVSIPLLWEHISTKGST